jgi:hypothetical protein
MKALQKLIIPLLKHISEHNSLFLRIHNRYKYYAISAGQAFPFQGDP